LASPVVAVADDSEVIETASIGEISEPLVAEIPTTEPLVIELVVEGNPTADSTESPGDAQPEEPADADTTSTATDPEPIGADTSPMAATLETGSGEGHTGGTGEDHTGGTGEDHTGGTGEDHTGGTGEDHTGGRGSGDPYRMTFVVSWRLPDDSSIPVLDDVLPTDWRMMFDLAAASETGGGKPTSAHCTYPPGSTDLVCEFQNPGHGSDADGMIVPAKKTATYSVTVLWPTSGWTIDGANAGPYSARDLCPRGGHDDDSGHDGGHDGGHGETLEAAALEESGSGCIHTVVMRRAAVPAEPPPAEPPAQSPPTAEVPAAEPPAQSPPTAEVPAAEPPPSQTPVPPAAAPATPTVDVLPVAVTPRALPATGNTATTTLMIGTIIVALGAGLSVLARRRNDLPLS
jgi:LPXTG-motif cell wall-anchored protein